MEVDCRRRRRVCQNQRYDGTHDVGKTLRSKVSKCLVLQFNTAMQMISIESDWKLSAMMLRKSNIYKNKRIIIEIFQDRVKTPDQRVLTGFPVMKIYSGRDGILLDHPIGIGIGLRIARQTVLSSQEP